MESANCVLEIRDLLALEKMSCQMEQCDEICHDGVVITNMNLMSVKLLLFLPRSISHNLGDVCCIMYKWTIVCEIFWIWCQKFPDPVGIRMRTKGLS